MVKMRAEAVRWHSDDFPGWVEVSLRDARGDNHCIVEKVSVITPLVITADSPFPIEFWIDAEAESVDGGETVVVLPCGIETTEGKRRLTVASTEDDRARYIRDRQWLDYAFHELPSGVLWGADGATAAQCADMLDGLEGFARVCARLGLHDHDEFIEACRWHFDHYPHFVGRRRHFADYATYIHARRGPLRVSSPERPDWLRRQ